MNKSVTLQLSAALSILAFSLSAFAGEPAEPVACSIPSPDPLHTPYAEPGIDLGFIVKQDLGTVGAWTREVEPSLQLDLDDADRFVNLTKGPDSQDLVFADSRDGYESLKRFKIEAGVGADLTWNYGNTTGLAPALFGAVGLIPLVGGGVEELRYFPNKGAMGNRAQLPMPGKALAEVDKLLPHDVLTYDATGGVVFWASVGYGFVGSASVAALARGDFEVRLVKIDDTHVHALVTASNLESIGLQLGNVLTRVSTDEFARYAHGLGFLIDFKSAEGARALHDLVYGNAAPVQKLAQHGSPDVQFLDEQTSHRIGNVSRLTLGIPGILGLSWERTHFFDAIRRRDYACGRSLHAVYGAYVAHNDGTAIDVEQDTTKAFYGASYSLNETDGGSPLARAYIGEMVWNWRGRKVLPDTFRKAMSRMATNSGLGAALLLNVPDSVTARLPYSALTLRARFRAGDVKRLLDKSGSIGLSRAMSLAGEFANNYLAVAATRAPLCDAIQLQGAACASKVVANTSGGVGRMFKALQEMKAQLAKGDEKAATRAFARFGEAMLTNPVTLRTGLELAGPDVPVDFVAEGSDFQRHVATLKVAPGSGSLTPDHRAPLLQNLGWTGLDSIRVTPVSQ
jgi:hypothetical protein